LRVLIQRLFDQRGFTGRFKRGQQGLFLDTEMGLKLGMEACNDVLPLSLCGPVISV